MENTSAMLSKLQLFIDEKEQLLFCSRSECGYALAVKHSQVTSHLRDKHQVTEADRRGLTKYLTRAYPNGFRNPADLPTREDGSDAHPQLRVHDGFSCRECPYYTINYPELSKHMSKNHLNGWQASRKRIQDLYDDVYLQSWTRGATTRYWTVRKDGQIIRPVAGRGAEEHLQSVYEREYQRLHAQERLQSSMETETPTFVATGPWMERTRWPETYQGVRRDILLGLAEMSSLYRSTEDYVIGRGSPDREGDVISSWQDERKIAALMPIIDDMLDRCEETVRHTSRVLLCWLRSTKPQLCYPKPFTLVALLQSKRKYRRIFKRFLALVLRAYRMSRDVRRCYTGIRFTKIQLSQLGGIWDHPALIDTEQELHASETWVEEEGDDLDSEDNREGEESSDGEDDEDSNHQGSDCDWEDTDEDGNDDHKAEDFADWADHDNGSPIDVHSEQTHRHTLGSPGGVEELREFLFQLSITFSTASFTEGQPSSSLLVYFSGILGFSSDARNFLPAKKFTPQLSALIYIQRLLFLEYALPYRAYPHIGLERRPRFRQHQHFETIRLRYMTTGSPSALEELQSLRDFGRVMSRTDAPSFLLRWSDDGQVIWHGDRFSLTMTRYRSLAMHFLTQAEALCNILMFDLRPKIDLASLKDDMTNASRGYSFVYHPKNGLADAYLELSSRACTTRRGGLFKDGRWDWGAIFQYEKQAENLAEMLVGGLHTACGQFPRASELLGLESTNGSSTMRGICVWNGFLIYVIRHHKAKRTTNREFNIVRFLPVQLGHSMCKYLVYIRPFLDMLQRERSVSHNRVQSSTLLFRGKGAFDKLWPSARLTAILKKATGEVWGQPVTSQLLRQLSIGITEKHVTEIHQPFNRFDDKGPGADLNVVFAWQSGHRPLQRGTTYGLDGAFPNQLQPALLRAYEWASTRWHEFLHLPSKVLPCTDARVLEEDLRSLSPLPQESPLRAASNRPAKRRSLPWHQEVLDPTRPAKRRALSRDSDLSRLDPIQLSQRQGPLPRTQDPVLFMPVTRQPAYPADIIDRAQKWEEGQAGNPVSDDECDSLIDWDEPDLIPSNAPMDGSLPSWSRAPWPSWRRHKERIAVKIDRARQFYGVFYLDELRSHEQVAMRRLQRSLDGWKKCCIVCDFKGNPVRFHERHSTNDCSDSLNRAVQKWASLFLVKLQRLAQADGQSCPVCLVPRLLCDRWERGDLSNWAETGVVCQYDGIIVLTIVTALEGAVEVREELDAWVDAWHHSRNLEKVCQWLSERLVNDDLYALRVVKMFVFASSAWGRMANSTKGYYAPSLSWITSIGPFTAADDRSDAAAHTIREQQRQEKIARTKREGRDWYDLDKQLLSWKEKCPICHTRQKAGFEVDSDHKLDECRDPQRCLAATEIEKLQGIQFAKDVCCSECAVPREKCEDTVYTGRQGGKRCFYDGIVREAVAAMIVVGPDAVVNKLYAWMRKDGIWTEDMTLNEEDAQQLTHRKLEWFSQRANWRHYTSSVLIQVFNQLDRWIEASGKGLELESWI